MPSLSERVEAAYDRAIEQRRVMFEARNAREKRGVTVMPEQVVVLKREWLIAPARVVAAEYADSHFCGVGGVQTIVDERLKRFLKPEGGRS